MLWASQRRRLDFCSNNSFLLHLVITSVVHNTNWHLGNALHHYIYSEYSPMPQQQPLFYSQSMWFIAWGEYALKSPVNMISPRLLKEAISSCNMFYIFVFGSHMGWHFWQKLGKDINPCWSPEPLSVFTAWNTFNIQFQQEIPINIAAGIPGIQYKSNILVCS